MTVSQTIAEPLIIEGEMSRGDREKKLAILKDSHTGAFAVLSCGRENRYGHPSPEVVKALKEQGARIWDTRERGAVMVWTDGRTMDISGYLDSRKGI